MRQRLLDIQSRQYLFMDNGPRDADGKTKGDKQREFHKSTARVRGVYTSNRWGKALGNNELCLTPDGWVPIGSIKVGDEVYSQNGHPVAVLGVFPQGKQACFRLTFDDGVSVVASGDHIWTVKTPSSRFKKTWKNKYFRKSGEVVRTESPNVNYGVWSNMTTQEIVDAFGSEPPPVRRVSIPVVEPVLFPSKEVPFDPYALGLLISDGSFTEKSRGCSFSTADDELIECLDVKRHGDSIQFNVRGVRGILNDIGLGGKYSWEKFVPDIYKWNSPDVRLGVLQGLMDTDGYIDAKNHAVEFSTTSERLAKDVLFIAQSLGGKGTIASRVTTYTHDGEKRKGRLSYRVDFRIPGVCPFRMVARWKDKSFGNERILVRVEPVGDVEATCIAVDHPSGLFVTNDFIVTHNTRMVAQEFLWYCTGTHPYKKTPHRAVNMRACADGWKVGVEGLLVPLFKKICDPDTLAGESWDKAYRQGDHTLTFKNGSMIQFMSYETADTGRGAQKFAGVPLDGFWHDEASPYSVWEENMARIVDRNGFAINTLTPVLGETWEYDGVYQRWQSGDPAFQCWTGSIYENELLDEKGPDHSKCFKIAAVIGRHHYAAAWGRNKKEAEQKAAMNALAAINGQPVPQGQLGTQIHAIFDNRPAKLLFIKAAGNRKYQEVIDAMDIARGSGIQVIGFTPKA